MTDSRVAISNRYDFVFLFDVENGNPNGDPDADNAPRQDADTGRGYITDVCIKSKIRNYVSIVKDGVKGLNILVRPDRSLNAKFRDAYEAEGLPLDKTKKGTNPQFEAAGRDYMCRNYYDVRMFGAVMTTGTNSCGIVKGPVQINFANSVSPIFPEEVTITRQARTSEERRQSGDTEMGHKHIVPYGLYRAEGYVSAALAQNSPLVTDEDIDLLWEAIKGMFELDHSASRGKMCVRRLFVFKHDSILGNAHSHELFDKIHVTEKEGVEVPRAFSDYDVTIDEDIPEGVELIVM